jgi:predicted amino acid racemase
MTSEINVKKVFLRVFLLLLSLSLWTVQFTAILKASYRSEITTEEIEKLGYEIVANSSRKRISQVSQYVC